MRTAAVAMSVAVAAVTSACGGGSTSPSSLVTGAPGPSSMRPTATAATTTSPTASTTTTASPSSTTSTHTATGGGLTVTETDNGRGITVPVATRITVVLHSTYWSIDGSDNSQVVRAVNAESHHPANNCLPGVGCGTVTETFAAVGAGTATVSASRTTCGEAMACAPSQRTFSVAIRVVG